jgi:hypothetical protein
MSNSGNVFGNAGSNGATSNNNFGEWWGDDSMDYYDPGTYGTIDVPFVSNNDNYSQDFSSSDSGGSDYGSYEEGWW